MNIIGDVDGKDCLLFDDIVDSGGTLVQRGRCPAGQGRHERHRLYHPWRAVGRRGCPHHRLEAAGTGDHRFDPADARRARCAQNIRVVSIADLIGEAISRTATEESVSSLFD